MTHKQKNTLYTLCDTPINTKTRTDHTLLSVTFTTIVDDTSKVYEHRRSDVNRLYFNIVTSLLPNKALKDLYIIRNYLASNDKSGKFHDKLDKIIDTIANGNLNY